MPACDGSGHAVALGYVREVPLTDYPGVIKDYPPCLYFSTANPAAA